DPARAGVGDHDGVALEAVARGVREQVPQGGAGRTDGILERDRALLDADEDRVAGEELADGRDAEDPVAVPSSPRRSVSGDHGGGDMRDVPGIEPAEGALHGDGVEVVHAASLARPAR